MAEHGKRNTPSALYAEMPKRWGKWRAQIESTLAPSLSRRPVFNAIPGTVVKSLFRRMSPLKSLPVFDYKDPHKTVHQLVKYTQDSINRLAALSSFGTGWEIHTCTVQVAPVLPPSTSWVPVAQITINVLERVLIDGEINLTTSDAGTLEFRIVRETVPIFTSATKDYKGSINDIVPFSSVIDSPTAGNHSYALQVRVTTSNITIRTGTRLTVTA